MSMAKETSQPVALRLPRRLPSTLRAVSSATRDGRYRYTQTKAADVIIVAREGLAFGHLETDEAVAPSEADREEYPPVKKVYLVRKSVRYGTPVRLAPLGISNYQFGKRIDEAQFTEILKLGGGNKEFFRN